MWPFLPINDYSIKEWYHRWVETGDSAILKRILDYNEDDCIAVKK